MSQLSTCPAFDLFDRCLASVRCAHARIPVRGESTPLLRISSVLVTVRSSITSVILLSLPLFPCCRSLVYLPMGVVDNPACVQRATSLKDNSAESLPFTVYIPSLGL